LNGDLPCVYSLTIPDGVQIHNLVRHTDNRGHLFEFYRDSWVPAGIRPAIQWNYFHSNSNVLRGVHVHRNHSDYLVLVSGMMLLGLCDIRIDSPTYRLSTLIKLEADAPKMVIIPPGVMHGFYFPEKSVCVFGVNFYFNKEDEFRCLWNDPGLGIPWPAIQPVLSDQDLSAPTFNDMLTAFSKPFMCVEA